MPTPCPPARRRAAALLIPGVLLSGALPAATFTVDSTADTVDAGNTTCASPCTLRQAITVANNTPGADTIAFNLPGSGEQVITVTTPLPSVEETTLIDGYTQPGTAVNTAANTFNALIRVRVQGVGMSGTVRGIALCASGSTVRGLSIGGFPNAQVTGGARADGSSCPSIPSNLTISGNLLGVGTDGNTDIGGLGGILFNSATNSVIGGPTIADRNVISGFTTAVSITGTSTGVQVLHNLLGVNATDTLPMPNVGAVSLGGNATNIAVGTLSAPNLIAHNSIGIQVGSLATGNPLTGNIFRLNSPGLGIDLNNNGAVNPNDVDDADTGANGLQNFPVISAAVLSGPDLVVTGSLDVGNPSDLPYELSVYATDRCDESGHGEGEMLLGVQTRNLRTTAEGFSLTVPYDGVVTGRRAITMLARHPTNGTSEFSQCFLFAPGSPLVVNTTDDTSDGFCSAAHCSLRDALVQAAASPGHDLISFAIPGPGPHRISPASAYPTLNQPVTIDGYTQPGAVANTDARASNASLRIIIDVAGITSNLFNATASGSTIRGLAIVGAGAAGSPLIAAAANTTITGNWFGIEPDGVTERSNLRTGITLTGTGIVVGGPALADRNVFAGFTSATAIASTDLSAGNVLVENNLFGLRPDGVTALRNATSISWIASNNNPLTVRANTFGCANTHLAGAGTLVESNRFGLAVDGNTAPTGTCDAGTISPRNGARLVQNRIASRVTNGRGVGVQNTITGVVLDRNAIFDVALIEIDLGADGPTANDPLDADTGANNRQNFPLLTRAQRTAPGSVTVDGTLNSLPNATFLLQFFADESVRRVVSGTPYANARWVSDDTLTVTTDASGNASFSDLVLDFPDAGFPGAINATATRLDGGGQPVETSELGPARVTFDPAQESFLVTNTNAIGEGSFLSAMLAAEANPDTDGQRDVIRFDIPGAAPFVITPAFPEITITGRLEIDGTSQPGSSVNTSLVGTNAVIPVELRNVSLLLENSPDTLVRGLSLSTTTSISQPFLRLGPGSRVRGNFIGVRSDGTTRAAATSASAFIDCIGGCGEIGGVAEADRNVIAVPTSAAVSAIAGGTTTASQIRGNLIGMQRDGVTPLVTVANSFPTPGPGVTHSILTRVAAAPGDLITGNTIGGGVIAIRVEGQGARIDGNFIGGRVIGGTPVVFRNGGAGIWINGGAQHEIIGNVIRNNGSDAIDVDAATTQAKFAENTMVGNSGLGIDLGTNGVSANDALDADGGANGGQNFPVINGVSHVAGGISVGGTLSSKASTAYRLRFCYVQAADNTNHGECDVPIPSATIDVTTAADGTVAFTTPLVAAVDGMTAVTATAAELVSGHELTSEFALNRLIQRATSVVVTATPEPSLAGQPFTVTASVGSLVGGSAPTGSVSVTTSPNVGSCTIASLTAGSGSCSITPAVSGTVTVTASYGGSTTTLGSLGTVAHTVDRTPATLTITNDSPDPSPPGSAFTVTFTATAPVGTPTGNVTVTASGGGSCTGALSGGQGFCVLTPTGTGNLTLTADYPGSTLHLPSQDTESHDVGAAASTMTIQSVSPSPSVFGQPVTVTAQLSATVGTPTGPIVVSDGAGASCEISGGSGSCQLVPVNVGNDITLRAEFSGNAGHTGSFATTSHVVDRAEVVVTVGTPFRADTAGGQPAQLAPMRVPVTVTAAPPGAGAPGGTVIVESVLGSEVCAIVLPETACDLLPLTPGTIAFTASYVGDTRFNERLESFAVDVLPSPLFGNGFECEDVCP